MASDKATDKKFTVTISINGQTVKEERPPNQKVEVAIRDALRTTQNKDDVSLYDITYNGKAIDVTKTWNESGIPENSTIIVANKPGKKA